jgi:3-oxoacyl-[acyl-carrier-protein] synthase-1
LSASLIENQKLRYCIVAGVDSFVRQDVVEYYLEKRRILTPMNSNGFSPGEAGSAILVGSSAERLETECMIQGIGISHEKATIESEEPLRGDGLSEAFNKALSQAGIEFSDFDFWLIDQNGEHYKFKEAMLSRIRLERLRKEPRTRPYEIWHPIEYIGEVGAAVVPCLLGLFLHACKKDYAPGPCAIMSISGDSGERAALVLKQIVRSG